MIIVLALLSLVTGFGAGFVLHAWIEARVERTVSSLKTDAEKLAEKL